MDYRRMMPLIYRVMITLSGLTWLWLAYWDAAWLTPLTFAVGIGLLVSAWMPGCQYITVPTFFGVTLTGSLQLVDSSLWHSHSLVLRPGIFPGMLLMTFVALLLAFSWVPARGNEV